jgi:hypothetical protein
MSGEYVTGMTQGEIAMTTPRHSAKSKMLPRIMIGAAVMTAGAGLLVPAYAFAASSTTNDLPARYERACLRIPNLTIRTDNFITRLQGDASTRGSLAWLQAQISDATAKNRTQLATVLQNRLAVRTQTLAVLQQRHDKLASLADKCRAHGVDI